METGDKPVILEAQPHGGALLRSAGPGRPKAREEAIGLLREAIFTETPDGPAILDAMIRKARKGDMRAIEASLHYGLGKPTDKVEVSGPDGGPIEHHVLDDDELRLLREAIREVQAEESGAEPDAGPEGGDVAAPPVGPGAASESTEG